MYQIYYEFHNLAASDYNIAPSGNVTILMGNTEQCITVSTNMTEAEETLVITWQPSLPYVNFTDGNQINVTIRQRKLCITCALVDRNTELASVLKFCFKAFFMSDILPAPGPTITFQQSTYSFPEGSNMQTVPIMLNEALGPGRNAIINVTYSGMPLHYTTSLTLVFPNLFSPSVFRR